MQKLSNQFRDRQETPLQRAVFWVEYVLRHKDVKNLSPKGRYMSFFAREKLDIAGFIVLSLFLFLYLLVILIKSIIRGCAVKKVDKVKQN